MRGKGFIHLAIILLGLFLSVQTFAQHENESKFNAGSFIIDHIGDAHEWHIVTIGETHISVPLPIIVYSKFSGLSFFSSGRLAHGESYNNFVLEHSGENKGKVVENIEGSKMTELISKFDTTEFSELLTNLNDQEFVAAKRDTLIQQFVNKDFASIEAYLSDKQFYYVPLDFSITKNVVALWVSLIILLVVFLTVAKSYKERQGSAPKGLQSFMEPIILFVRDDIARPSIGEEKYHKYMPYLLTVFFFIFINNLMGLIPIPPFGANLTGNIAVTMVLALFTFVITTVSGNNHYWTHIINTPGVPWWLKIPVPLMPIVEISGVFIKPFVLMVRLFANITAGHIIVLGFFSLIFIFGDMSPAAGFGASILSVAFVIFMTMLELLVAFIQAFVFTLLSALYFGLATEEPHHH